MREALKNETLWNPYQIDNYSPRYEQTNQRFKRFWLITLTCN